MKEVDEFQQTFSLTLIHFRKLVYSVAIHFVGADRKIPRTSLLSV